jgi:hypothetical protein
MDSGSNTGLFVTGGALALLGAVGGCLAGANQPSPPSITVNEKPGLCRSSGSKANQPVVAKVGKESTQPDFSEDCEVPGRAVLSWVAHTSVIGRSAPGRDSGSTRFFRRELP